MPAHADRTWVVYVVRCADDSLYVGHTNDLAARLLRHNDGTGAAYTRGRRPVHLAWSHACKTAREARVLEGLMKGLHRKKRLLLIADERLVLEPLMAELHRRCG